MERPAVRRTFEHVRDIKAMIGSSYNEDRPPTNGKSMGHLALAAKVSNADHYLYVQQNGMVIRKS